MGIAFGLGVVFGVRAAEFSLTGILPVITLLIATSAVAGSNARRLCVVAALGAALGAAAGLRNPSEDMPLLVSPPDGPIVGEIQSDVGITPRGGTARFRWRDDDGIARQSTLFAPPAPLVSRGERIQVFGTIGGARGERVYADAVRVVRRAGWLESQRRAIREYIADAIEDRVPGTPGALTLGLLIGDDTALTDAEREALKRAGLSHLTAVSGWNVTLVTSAVGLLCLRLGLRGWMWTVLQLLALSGFVWIVGLEPPVTRAAIMAVAGLAAIRLGRPAHSVTVLTLSAAAMVAVSPASLTSLPFQLSFVATLGLIVAGRLSQELVGWRGVALTPLIATAAAGILTAPLLASKTGSLSLLTVPANILAAPFVPLATIAGVVVIATSPLALIPSLAGSVATLLCTVVLWLARAMATTPYGYYEFAPLPGVAQAGMCSALLLAVTLILPEGRLIAHSASAWVRREPLSAALSVGTACVALVTAALTV